MYDSGENDDDAGYNEYLTHIEDCDIVSIVFSSLEVFQLLDTVDAEIKAITAEKSEPSRVPFSKPRVSQNI